MTDTPPRRLDYVRLDEVEHAPRNPKAHDTEAIGRSISHHGMAEVPLRDERTGRLVAGHGRHNQLTAMHAAGETAPDGILVDDDGMWRMPVIAGWASRSDADAEAYLVGSNQITTAGGWDDGGLADILRDLDTAGLLDLTGFDDEALAGILEAAGNENPFGGSAMGGGDPDDVDLEPPVEPITAPGDVWLLGPHRLICGDSTTTTTWDTLMRDDTAQCIWTDPPYGVSYVGKTKDALTIENDSLNPKDLRGLLDGAFAHALRHADPGSAWYVAAPPGPLHLVFGNCLLDLGVYRQQIIWAKDVFVLGHADYHYKHEPIFYGYSPGYTGRRGRGGEGWYGDNAQDTLWEIPRPKRSEDHPTMKPVELVTKSLTNSTQRGDIVVDCFGGSGTTLVAAQITGRVARLIELGPRYCDVIARRYQELTGELPFNERLGEPVDLIGAQP